LNRWCFSAFPEINSENRSKEKSLTEIRYLPDGKIFLSSVYPNQIVSYADSRVAMDSNRTKQLTDGAVVFS
jgi:hypothetical protein